LSDLRSNATGDAPANGPSVEHRIGQALRNGQPRGSIDLAVNGQRLWVDGVTYNYGLSHFYFEGAAQPVRLQVDPLDAFNSLFARTAPPPGPSHAPPPDPAAQALYDLRVKNKSVLDAVRGSLLDLRSGLNRTDRQRLEAHAQLIREIELGLPPQGSGGT